MTWAQRPRWLLCGGILKPPLVSLELKSCRCFCFGSLNDTKASTGKVTFVKNIHIWSADFGENALLVISPQVDRFPKIDLPFFCNSNLFCHLTICLISSQAEIHRHRAQFILDFACSFDDMCSLYIAIWKLKSEFHCCKFFNNIYGNP